MNSEFSRTLIAVVWFSFSHGAYIKLCICHWRACSCLLCSLAVVKLGFISFLVPQCKVKILVSGGKRVRIVIAWNWILCRTSEGWWECHRPCYRTSPWAQWEGQGQAVIISCWTGQFSAGNNVSKIPPLINFIIMRSCLWVYSKVYLKFLTFARMLVHFRDSVTGWTVHHLVC